MTDAKQTSFLTDTKKPANLATLTQPQRLELLETMRTMEAREWVQRYRKKVRDLGKIKASAWWSQVYLDIEKRRGSAAAVDLRKRMNETR
ncbi:MAG: hypothetical protein EBR60_02100 [Burkholderiaceae bacterium]|nr:hypothetical protein [Burkholderiaceae bacterium]